MGKKKGRHVVLLLDESGSMAPVKSAVQEAVKEFLATLDVSLGGTVSIATFDAHGHPAAREPVVRYALRNKPVEGAAKAGDSVMISYSPRGYTPLHDAVHTVIADARDLVGKKGEAMVVIYTDGHENASREASAEDVRKQVAELQEQGWAFIFLGADIDAWGAAANIGMATPGSSLRTSNTKAGIAGTAGALTTMVTAYRRGASAQSVYAANIAEHGTMPTVAPKDDAA